MKHHCDRGLRNSIGPYKLYIFDFDLTLFDTSKGAISCMEAAFAVGGIAGVGEDEITKGTGLSLKEFFGRYVVDTATIGLMEAAFLKRSTETMVELAVPCNNVISVVRVLHARGAKLAICTGKYRDRVYRILAKYSIEKEFDLLVCGDEVARNKPDPEGLIKCMEQFEGIGRDEIAYIGDHPYDIIAAHRCEIDSIAITSGSTPRSELMLSDPTYMIDDLVELLA